MQKFSPRYTYNVSEDMINYWVAQIPIEQGLLVEPDNDGNLQLADDYGYFIVREVTADGPSYMERKEGLYQWDVKVGNPVSVLRPKNKSIVRTVHVSDGGALGINVGDLVNIANGAFVTAVDGTKGKIMATPTEIGVEGYYDVMLYV